MENDLFWTLADYQRFIQDPDYFARDWAANRIEEQYPQAAAQSFKSLLNDDNDHLRISAARAIIESPSPEFEADLLAALPTTQSYTRRWMLKAIGAIRSETILPWLIQECDALPERHTTGTVYFENIGLVDALGYYPDPEARAALWRLLERYQHDDTLARAMVAGLLNHPDNDTFTSLARLIQRLRPAQEFVHFSTIDAVAEACLVYPLANHLYENLGDPGATLETLNGWMDDILEFSNEFIMAFYKKARQRYRGVLDDILSEADRYCTETGQSWSNWDAVWTSSPPSPGTYHWRMAMAYQFMAAFATNPPRNKNLYRRTVGLCLALLGQFTIDEDDEALLAAATSPAEELNALVEILNSPRQNVLPDFVERLAARGPVVLPALIAALQQEEFFWPRVRALDTITRLAQRYPGAADPAIPDILDQIQEGESDYILEAAENALKTIGPAVVTPAFEWIDYEDYSTYEIYILGTLAEIPTHASVQAFLDYHEHADADEFAIELLADLAHPQTLPLLRSYYLEDPDPNLAEFCYKVAYLNQIDDPLLAQWKMEALESWAEQHEIIERLEGEETADQAVKKDGLEGQIWSNMLASTFARYQDEPLSPGVELDEQDQIEIARQKEAARRAEAKAKAKRKQQKKSRKQQRKRK